MRWIHHQHLQQNFFFPFGKHPENVEKAFLQETQYSDISEIGDRYIGKKAINYLFEVMAGLDSQILGDFEIVGQIKTAFEKSKKYGTGLGIIEKVVNQAIFSSRRIKTKLDFQEVLLQPVTQPSNS